MYPTTSNGLTTPHSQPAETKTLRTNSNHPNGNRANQETKTNDQIIEVAKKLGNPEIGRAALPNNCGENLHTHGDAIASHIQAKSNMGATK